MKNDDNIQNLNVNVYVMWGLGVAGGFQGILEILGILFFGCFWGISFFFMKIKIGDTGKIYKFAKLMMSVKQIAGK